MEGEDLVDRLGATTDDPGEVTEHLVERSDLGRDYRALTDARHGVERGTVLADDVVVRGFPSIPRTLMLEPGVAKHFDGEVAVEEKLDGCNVRIADVDGPLAFTRSGYVCAYTTDRARDLLDLRPFFDEHPTLMLCAELVGPETPYTTHAYGDVDSHELRVFDVRERATGEPLSVRERRELCAEFGFPRPKLFGVYDADEAADVVKSVVHDLDSRGREGVVLKSSDGRRALKYTTGSQHSADLAFAFTLPFDRGRDFLFSRLVRDAFQAVEFDEDDETLRERAHELGESILLPMVETVRTVRDGGLVGERRTVRGDPDAVDALFDHLEGMGVTLEVEDDRTEDEERVVTFVKISAATRDKVSYYLEGGTVDE